MGVRRSQACNQNLCPISGKKVAILSDLEKIDPKCPKKNWNEEMSDLRNEKKEEGKKARSNITDQKRTKSVELWSYSCGARRLRG